MKSFEKPTPGQTQHLGGENKRPDIPLRSWWKQKHGLRESDCTYIPEAPLQMYANDCIYIDLSIQVISLILVLIILYSGYDVYLHIVKPGYSYPCIEYQNGILQEVSQCCSETA